MSELNGHYYFTRIQLEKMLKGREIKFTRGGKAIIAGMKKKHKQIHVEKLYKKIEYYKKKLADAGVKE